MNSDQTLLTTYVPSEIKFCIACNKPVRGRTDKKFCNDNCRNNFNNRLKSECNNRIRNINNALGKNRRILESMFANGQSVAKASSGRLLNSGFRFKYFTHQYNNKKGQTYFFCYDLGYRPLQNGWYQIVRNRSDESNTNIY